MEYEVAFSESNNTFKENTKPFLNGKIDRRTKPRKTKGVVFSWTNNPDLLLQYFDVREKVYKKYHNLDFFPGALDEVDVRGNILVALKDGVCIGGARLTVSDPLLKVNLPMEDDSFLLRDILPEYDLYNKGYAEYSRLLFEEEYMNGAISASLFRSLNQRIKKFGIQYVFCISPLAQARHYQRVYQRQLHLPITIRTDIEVPKKPIHCGIKMYLSVLEF